jgi:hypothetical protein
MATRKIVIQLELCRTSFGLGRGRKSAGPRAFGSEKGEATCSFDRLAECDVIIICVPTPLGIHREPELKYVRTTAEAIASVLRPLQHIRLESTIYPGTTREGGAATGRVLVCGREDTQMTHEEWNDVRYCRSSFSRRIDAVTTGAWSPG